MNDVKADAKAIFLEALDCEGADELMRFLEQACGADAALRARVEELLRAHRDAGAFLGGGEQQSATCDQPSAERPGTVIGPYKLLQQIGEGGMGTVFMAEQTQPVQRKVALKVIKPGMDSRHVIARFEAERQALAMMDHVNIARVFDAGATESGRPYFVMELVHGVPITKYCDDNRLTPRQRLELFVPVCQAIQHAHQKGIIHRDVKPSNVMITLYDGKPVPKVIDFGVAKATEQKLTERTLFTQYGTMVGTLEYMSPEQAEMSGLGVDTRSDIYSLGVLLYELLTGSTPLTHKRLKEAAYSEILRMIKEEEPPRPSTRLSDSVDTLGSISAQRHMEPAKLTKLVRGELDWIVMKCLEKDRNRRYETASGIAADVRRYLSDEPVQACPPSAWYRFRKFARRNKAVFMTVSVIVVALLMAVATLAVSSVLVWQAKDDLQEALGRERQDSYFHRITLAHRELSADNLGRALQYLRECPEDLRGWEWHYLMRLCRVEPLVIRDKAEVNSLAFSPDGELLASAGGHGAVKIWNSKTGKVIQTLDAHADAVFSVAFHPDGKHLASVGADQQVKVWDWRNRQLLHALRGHEKLAISVAFSRDSRRLASGSFRGSVKLWGVEAGGEPLCTLSESSDTRHPVAALAFSPDGGHLATASFGRRVDVWNTTTGQRLHELRQNGVVLGVAFSPDGRRLASAGEDKTVHIWDATTGREVLGLRGHTGPCGCVTFSRDGGRLASACMDGTIRLWDATPLKGNEGQETLTFTQHSDEIWSVAVSPDGQKIASADFGMLVKVWDAQTGRVNVEFSGHRDTVFCVAWQPDGERIASAGWDGWLFTVKVWDAQTGQEVFALPGGPEEFMAVAFSPDRPYLVTGRANGTVQVWNARTGREVGTLGTHARHIRGVVFSRDGRHLASASGDGMVKLWDAKRLDQKQEAYRTLRARVPGQCLNVAFSQDGRRLATGGEENTVKIWDVQTGQVLQTLRGHNGEVYTVAFSPDDDSRWVASAGEDSTVKVWDSQTGRLVRSFRGHTGLVSSVAFNPDGRHLVSGSRDHTVKVWDVTQLEEVPDR
jgi:WD40 repeat protein/serine/threonine protein kinase